MKRDTAWRSRLFAACAILLTVATGFTGRAMAAVDVVATGLHFPEGAIFIGNSLYFVDYSTSDVLRMVNGKVARVWHQDGCGANGLAEVRSELLVACYDNGTVVRMTHEGHVLETIGHDDAGGAFVSPNDLAADSAGGVYFTASGNRAGTGKVYYRAPTGGVKMLADGIDNANGIAVSNDGARLYLAESGKRRLLVFRIGPGGALSGQTELVRLADVLADGRHAVFSPDTLRVDRQGRLFVGLYFGGGIAVLAGDGKLLKMIPLPGEHHASLAISPDGTALFVTATDDTPDGGYRGALLRIDNPVAE